MQYSSGMLSYYEQLICAAKQADVQLIQAFRNAGIPTSTYYRAANGTDLHLSTAKKVFHWIDKSEVVKRI
tara:strand:+ start:960 stop:1169 length:210 start_codon:yes stop_codon:yes gene_type:complete